ncbi:hypothetical protein [Goodfellowiella coeruleoviolacea]|uniref:Uncharacterized protein n=1 Tax=Goodfellowiella coeruleoviolacea TaxID=334858 RepID=A0AAE3KJF4_9PSEU|nr:hypothetical protein [Goodfellowiella coeruleoviolacea]MCP2168364.1 hypothetical protein [Goodfellowiella coeruleoviolacea]
MTVDVDKAAEFVATHARLLDRRRFELMLGRGGADAVAAALSGYANADGGYGWGLEPDMRSARSQPAGALHAFETFAEIGTGSSVHTARLCDWLDTVTLPDGGLPFSLPVSDPAGSAPWWLGADPDRSSLHGTAMVAAAAHRVARHDRGVREHPWLARASEYCRREIAALAGPRNAYEFRFVLAFLDATHEVFPWAPAELDRLGALVPESGVMAVEGGIEDETLRPLDISPLPDRPVRRLFSPAVIEAELDRLAAGQRPDGGWTVDFATQSPASALEWRGHVTVRAIRILRAHHRIAG